MANLASTTRKDVNRLYAGFNSDCGRDAKLLSNPVLSRPVENNRFLRLEINPEFGQGFWDVLRLQEGLLMCVAQGSYHNVHHLLVAPPSELITLRMVVSGEIECADENGARIHLHQGSASLMRSNSGVHEVLINDQRPLASVTFHFHANRFARLIGIDQEQIVEAMVPILSAQSNYASIPLTQMMSNAVLDLTSSRFEGVLRQRYFEAKALELACLFVDAVKRQDRGASDVKEFDNRLDLAARRAHEILTSNFSDPPRVTELARSVGTNRTQLRNAFKRVYGVTINDFITTQRMELARTLLSRPENSIKSVALMVGYQYAANFSNAFRRYYGVSPREVRKADFRSC